MRAADNVLPVRSCAERQRVRTSSGYAGALLCNNAELASDFAGKVARSVLHSLAKSDAAGKAYPELGSSSDDALRRLSGEVRAR